MSVARENDGSDEGWIEWGGGECPVERETLVHVKLDHTDLWELGPRQAVGSVLWPDNWEHTHPAGHGQRIIAYRIHKES